MATTTLSRYYEDELVRLRELSAEFGREYPLLAPMFGAPSGDPDVERLLEGVAFLTGLARRKLDDGLPELVQALADLLSPHSLRPVPAATLIAFEPRGALRERAVIAAGTEIESGPVDGTACRFRTCGELDIEPISLAGCRFVPPAHGGGARAPARLRDARHRRERMGRDAHSPVHRRRAAARKPSVRTADAARRIGRDRVWPAGPAGLALHTRRPRAAAGGLR